jgi:hypothetical protein
MDVTCLPSVFPSFAVFSCAIGHFGPNEAILGGLMLHARESEGALSVFDIRRFR